MFKLLEKSPFVKWKFVQRMVHKRRMSTTTGTNRYKTFSKTQPSADVEELYDSSSYNESEYEPITRSDKGAGGSSSSNKSPFYSRRKLDKANAEIGIVTHAELEASPRTLRKGQSLQTSNDVDEIINTEEVGGELEDVQVEEAVGRPGEVEEVVIENHLISASTENRKPQYNPLSFRQNSKLRTSFKELKRRSLGHIDSARESVRRRANARKYDNLDNKHQAADDEIVNYDRSPGSKRRPQLTRSASFRKSLRQSGKYIVAGLQQMPAASLVRGVNASVSFPV